MSGHKGHLAAGLIAYGALLAVALIVELSLGVKLQYLLRSWLDIPIQIMVLALFSLWPDVDIASKARKLSYRLALALDLYLLALAKWEAAAFVGLAAILPGIGKHRGWTHTVAAALLLPVPILLVPLFVTGAFSVMKNPHYDRWIVGLPFYIAATVGYLSHLAADGLLWSSITRLRRSGRSRPKRSGRPGRTIAEQS